MKLADAPQTLKEGVAAKKARQTSESKEAHQPAATCGVLMSTKLALMSTKLVLMSTKLALMSTKLADEYVMVSKKRYDSYGEWKHFYICWGDELNHQYCGVRSICTSSAEATSYSTLKIAY